MIVVNSEKEVFNSSTVLEKMASIRVTSCNLLPGSKLMTMAPLKDNLTRGVKTKQHFTENRVKIAKFN